MYAILVLYEVLAVAENVFGRGWIWYEDGQLFKFGRVLAVIAEMNRPCQKDTRGEDKHQSLPRDSVLYVPTKKVIGVSGSGSPNSLNRQYQQLSVVCNVQ